MIISQTCRRNIAGIVCITLIGAYTVMAGYKPQIKVLDLLGADQIVIGRVKSLQITDQTVQRNIFGHDSEFGIWKATIKVERVIQGQAADGDILLEFPGPVKGQNGVMGGAAALESVSVDERAVFFLRRWEGHLPAFTFANDFKSTISLADSPAVARLLEKRSSSSDAKELISSLIAASMESYSDQILDEAIADLMSLKGKEANGSVMVMIDRTQDRVVRGKCLTALIRMGEFSRMKEAAEFLLSAPESSAGVLGVQKRLSAEMRLVKDTNLVAKYYVPLLEHPNDDVRRNIVYAVRKAKLQITVPNLIQGLKDCDLDVRYQCLMGLAEITGRTGVWAPSKPVFEKNEREYLDRWLDWWDKSGRLEFKPAH